MLKSRVKKFFITTFILIFVSVFFLSSCKEERFEVSTEARLNVFLTGLSLDFADHLKSINLQKYQFITERNNRFRKVRKSFSDFIFSEVNRQTISGWYSRRDYIEDPYLKRQVVLLANLFLINSVDYYKSIEEDQYRFIKDFVSLRFRDDERLLTLSDVRGLLHNAPFSKRRNLYDGMVKKTEPLKGKIIKLISLRNRTAAGLGYKDYADLVFRAEEIEREQLDSLLKALEKKTEDIYKSYLKQVQTHSENDYRDIESLFSPNTGIDFRKGLDSIRVSLDSTLEKIGIDTKGKIEYLRIPTNFSSMGFTIAIPGRYSFIIPETGSNYVDFFKFVKAYGVGIYYTHLFDKKRILSGFCSVTGARSRIFTSMIGHLSRLLLEEASNAGESKLQIKSDSSYEIYNLRRRLMMADFEWSLYLDPEIDPDLLYRNLVERYLMVGLQKDIGTDWPACVELIDNPFSFAMDIAGEIAAYQVLETLHNKIGKDKIVSGKYGQWLRNKLFRFGELYPWYKKVRDVTAEELNVRAIAQHF